MSRIRRLFCRHRHQTAYVLGRQQFNITNGEYGNVWPIVIVCGCGRRVETDWWDTRGRTVWQWATNS